MSAKVVVAADGRRSMVVRETGRTLRRHCSTSADVCAVKRHYCAPGSLDPDDRIELHSFPGGYAGTCRLESGIVNLCTLLPVPLLRRARGNIERALGWAFENCRVAELLSEAEPLGDWKTVPDVHLQRSQARLPGVLYVGDAMGTVDPLGGEGMAMALEGAQLAAGFLEQAISSRAGVDRELQQSYQSAWNCRFHWRIQLCRAFSGLLARPALLSSMLPTVLGDVWPQTLLPLAFRATRGRPSPKISAQKRRLNCDGKQPDHCSPFPSAALTTIRDALEKTR